MGLCMNHSSVRGQKKEISKKIIDHRISIFGKCKHDDCNLPALSKTSGICYRHYNKYGEPTIPKRRILSGCLVSFIYLLENTKIKAQKIGITNNPVQRISYFIKNDFKPIELRVGDSELISKIENQVIISIYKNGWNFGLEISKDLAGYTECWNYNNFKADSISDICSVENTAKVTFSNTNEK